MCFPMHFKAEIVYYQKPTRQRLSSTVNNISERIRSGMASQVGSFRSCCIDTQYINMGFKCDVGFYDYKFHIVLHCMFSNVLNVSLGQLSMKHFIVEFQSKMYVMRYRNYRLKLL